MKLLHTSDWHLGHTLNRRSREREFAAFLDWMLQLVDTEGVDVFLLAGDVFDTAVPKPEVQKMYYDFLREVSKRCRQTVVVAGNHDSPRLLDAPKTLLESFNVYVVGAAELERELLIVRDEQGTPTMLLGAVPFLWDHDLRRAEAGESAETREQKTVAGLKQHYRELCDRAESLRTEFGKEIPLVVSGHLFVLGGQTSEGVRESQVGNLGRFGTDVFPESIDYLALGHLHLPQLVGGSEARRYSGSPLVMNFDDTEQEKVVLLVDFDGRTPTVRKIPVPRTSRIVRVRGDLDDIQAELKTLETTNIATYVEVVYDGKEAVGDLMEKVDVWAPKHVDVLRIRNEREFETVRLQATATEQLEDLNPLDVFNRLLDEQKKRGKEIAAEMEPELLDAFKEIVETVKHNG